MPEEKEKTWVERHWIITGVLVLFFIGIIITSLDKSSSPPESNKLTDTTASNQPVYSVNSVEILEEFKSNEIRAEDKYKDKIISVDGIIGSIGTDILNDPYVVLREEYAFNGVQCMFKDKNELISLSTGDYATLKGRVSGFTLGNVIVRDCSVVS